MILLLRNIIMISCLIYGLSISISYAGSTSQDNLTDVVQKIIPNASSASKEINYTGIAQEIEYWIFAIVGIIAIVYIVWVGAKLIWAPGNVEEVSTAMKSLGYIVIGLAIIPFAWFIISFIINFSIR